MGGHYTQMIAQNTKEIGCGIASGKGSVTGGSMTGESVYLVCHYNPQGNTAAPQAVGEEDAAAPLQEEGAAAPLDDQGAAAPPDEAEAMTAEAMTEIKDEQKSPLFLF